MTATASIIIAVRAEVIVIAAVVVAVLVIAAAGEGLQLLLLPLILPYLNLHCVHYPQHPSSISFLASRSHSPPLRHGPVRLQRPRHPVTVTRPVSSPG